MSTKPKKPVGRPVGFTFRQSDSARNLIRVSRLIKKLQNYSDGKLNPVTGRVMKGKKDVTMTKDQITAATLLLSKALPSLQSTENTNVNNTHYIPVTKREDDPRTTTTDSTMDTTTGASITRH